MAIVSARGGLEYARARLIREAVKLGGHALLLDNSSLTRVGGDETSSQQLTGKVIIYSDSTRPTRDYSLPPLDPSPRLAAVARFAFWMDAGIRIPGTNLRFGLDPILGLIPGAGDAAGAVLAGWILVEAIRLGASRATVLRIAGNVALDALVGAVPVLGDIFDFAWKANLRNVALLERHLATPARAARADRSFVVLVMTSVLMLVLGVLVLGMLLARWAFHAVGVA